VSYCYVVVKNDKAQRLALARAHAGYDTPTQAARAFGWEVPTYRSHEAARRPYDDEQAVVYARAFRVAPEWLLFGRNAPRWTWLKVMSYVGAGAEVLAAEEPFDEIEPPPGCEADAFALIVRGSSMAPAMADGDILICRWRDDVSDLVNRTAVVDLADGRRLVKRVTRGERPGTHDLIGLDLVVLSGVTIERVAEIVWHKLR
jgi:phage repressor protein C with HTH and peptisase S24 domain